MNDTYIDTHKPIFEVIQEINDSDKNTLQKEGPLQLSGAFKEEHASKSAEASTVTTVNTQYK
jgi:hypothetical protein